MKVVHIDDDLGILEFYGAAIRNAGFDHIAVNQSIKAIDAISQAQPKVILLDIVMPELNGIELLKQIKSEPIWQPIPVIFLTSMPYETTGELAKKLGAYGYLSKRYYTPEMVVGILEPLLH